MTASATSPTSILPSPDLDDLSAFYTVKDEAQIGQFLAAHPSTQKLLQDAPAHIQFLFGADTPVLLEVCFDPEYPQRRELWAFILVDMTTPEKTGEAERNLRRLHDEWLIQLPRALSGSVHFDVEFR